MATKMKMVKKDGKMVPAFAADGKGKMMMGGPTKYKDGGYIRVKGKTGASDSITKNKTTMSGGTKTKTISGGPLVPNAVGKVTKTKTNADGTLNRASVKSVSGDRASKKISKYKMGGAKPKAMYGASMTPAMMQSEMMKEGGKVKKVMKKKK